MPNKNHRIHFDYFIDILTFIVHRFVDQISDSPGGTPWWLERNPGTAQSGGLFRSKPKNF